MEKYFIICSNVLGGCSGTTGPGSINPDTGEPYRMNFPVITIQDMVRAQKLLIDHLGIRKLLSVVGGSMGGMLATQWAISYPEMVSSVIAIATAIHIPAQAIAFNVEHVNRGPQYVGPAVIDVPVNGVSSVYTYDALFTDPDGDEMVYHASMPENAFASLFTDPAGFIVNGRSQGETTLTLTATDALGLSTSAEVKVNVARPDAIGSATAADAVAVSPNPVKTTTAVTLGKDAQTVTYRLYDTAGKLLQSSTAGPLAAGTPQRLDLSGYASGVYYLEVTADGERHNVTLLKK